MSVITYKCPNCDGGLVFDPESGSYVCEYCLSKFTEEELAVGKEKEKANEPENTTEQNEHTEGAAVVYHCPSCGAEIVTEETTVATFCFYCHNPVVLTGKLQGEYLPDGIIPFKISREEAVERFQEWIRKKKFIPSGFYAKRQIEKMTGVYFPYWLYDCEKDSYLNGTARNVRVWRVGDTEYTETKTYAVRRGGKVQFHHLPKTALQKAQTALLKGIFPYHFQELEPFHMGYLSGFQAEKRDIEKDSLRQEIHKEIEKYTRKRMRDTVDRYQHFSEESSGSRTAHENFAYTLLPVWVMTYKERGSQVYYFAMNGQTGEVIGKLPVDYKKLSILGAVIFVLVFAVFMIGGLFL